MNIKSLLPRLFATVLTSSALLPALALEKGHFPTSSILKQGKWTAVGINESGIYEISYDELKAMGYADPSKVGVFGYGSMLPEDFNDANGKVLVPGQIPAVPVFHSDGKLIFYAQGPEKLDIVASSDLPYKAIYSVTGRNIYSAAARYYLSDSSVLPMADAAQPSADGAKSITSGLGNAYHEQMLARNPLHVGKVYVGEAIGADPVEIPFSAPLAVVGADGVVTHSTFSQCYEIKQLCTQLNDSEAKTSLVSPLRSVPKVAVSNYVGKIVDKNNKVRFYISDDYPLDSDELSNLVRFTITYKKSFPYSSYSLTQERYLIESAADGTPCTITLPSESTLAMQVTDRSLPSLLRPAAGSRTITVGYDTALPADSLPDVIIFNPKSTLKHVAYAEPVVVSDLRERMAEGADMLVICVPSLRHKAEKLAAIHQATDGQKVSVATTREIYTEFSAGAPDPMAYRSLVRMMRDCDSRPLRNVLLMGPLTGNLLAPDAEAEHDPYESIIAWQTDFVDGEDYAYNYNEFVGLGEDYSDKKIYARKVSVGVGVIPCNNEAEADIFIDKTARFLQDTSFAYRLNRMIVSGDYPDAHQHQKDALTSFNNLLASLGNKIISHPVMLDALPLRESRTLFFNTLATQPLMATYFGHGEPSKLSNDFIRGSDVPSIKNEPATFMTFMGCDFTRTDMGRRGIGEQMVLSTPYGIFGGLVSNRSTKASGNIYAFKNFYNHMLRQGIDEHTALLDTPRTLGETSARWRSTSQLTETLILQLMADPSLTLPLPTLKISADASASVLSAGKELTVTGKVLNTKSLPIADFNGEVVVRVMAPEQTVNCQHFLATKAKDKNDFSFVKADQTVALSAAKVVNGEFTCKVVLPTSASALSGDALIYVAAYETEKRLGAGGTISVTYEAGEPQEADKDLVPPVIEALTYDPVTSTLRIEASDNKALSFSQLPFSNDFAIVLDGNDFHTAIGSHPIFDGDQKRYTRSVGLGALTNGRHRAEVTLSDADGNTVTGELVFQAGLPEPTLTLNVEESALFSEATLTLEGLGDADATLEICTADGEIVGRLPISDALTWDGTDDQGNRLPTGVYTLRVLAGDGTFSAPLRLPVITAAESAEN